jgi:enoyl-CoA hydratase/carnithine racemase
VAEVLPREKLLPRAWELATEIARRPPLVTRYTRALLTHHLKQQVLDLLGYGLALEALGSTEGLIESQENNTTSSSLIN